MALWKVQAGRHGEQEAVILDQSVVAIGWNDLPDLSNVQSREQLEEIYKLAYPNENPKALPGQVGQVWAFRSRI